MMLLILTHHPAT